MRKKIVSVISILLLIFIFNSCDSNSPTVSGIGNLAMNSDFEAVEEGKPVHWLYYSIDNQLIEICTDKCFSPGNSVKISMEQPDSVRFGMVYQVINSIIPRGRQMTLKVKIKTENIVGDGVYIAVKGGSYSGSSPVFVTSQGRYNITGTRDWQEYSIDVDPFTNMVEVVYIYLIYSTNTTGMAYFDDVELLYER